MNCFFITLVSFVFLLSACFADKRLDLKDQKDRESYSLGYQSGENIKNQKLEINLEAYIEGIRSSLGGKEPLMKPDEIQSTLTSYRQKLMAAQEKALKEAAAKNLAEGKAFLTENGKKEGVKTLPSGLQYMVLAEGSGRTPKKTETVTVNYRGSLINGTEIYSTHARQKPETFRVDSVIPGWAEALQLMKKGAKWQLFLPPALAYGERGQPAARIPPNSALILEVEIISIK